MTEKRRYTRKPVPQDLVVRDGNTQRELGRLVNLSAGGMMLFCPEPIASNGVYQCSIDLSDIVNCDIGAIEFGIESLWCQASENPGAYWAGFRIIDIAAEHETCLQRFLEGL